jgi:signal transduction histidine kinase
VKYAGRADVVRVEEAGATVTISVADRGPGVPQELRPRLFERFSRADDARDRPGTGLGLFITRELARANGGDVVHRDGSPGGAVFELTLPAAVAS